MKAAMKYTSAILLVMMLDPQTSKAMDAPNTQQAQKVHSDSTVWLSRRMLTTVPPEVFQMKSMQSLTLSWNLLASLPDSFGVLQELNAAAPGQGGGGELTMKPPIYGVMAELGSHLL